MRGTVGNAFRLKYLLESLMRSIYALRGCHFLSLTDFPPQIVI
jgi:hypothetical protein